jgi:transposase
VRVKKGEQPWVIRQGQEYKSKIIGRGQKTGTDGHSSASTRAAIKAAKRGDVEVVTLDRGVNRLLPEGSKVKPNTRPDTAYRTTDRKIHQLETPSKTDDPQKLMQRMEGTKESFPQEMRGETMLNYIKESLND